MVLSLRLAWITPSDFDEVSIKVYGRGGMEVGVGSRHDLARERRVTFQF